VNGSKSERLTVNGSPIPIGMNARLFPNNWRPALEEIAFARDNGFRAIQFPGPPDGLGRMRLGDDLDTIAGALRDAGVTAVMEMVVHVYDNGLTEDGRTPLDILKANLPAITTLPCPYVHWHLVSLGTLEAEPIRRLETGYRPQFIEAVEIARNYNFKFGLEHNEPELMLFSNPESCQEILMLVPGLHFVWDFNHTTPENLPAIQTMIPRMSMLHVSDTPLPEVNYHLPLGLGTVDLEGYFRALQSGGFSGPAILEIGGLPKSGGFGRDTDAALIDSRQRLERVTNPPEG
jgi:sugar phosphate isomerase/epimerase